MPQDKTEVVMYYQKSFDRVFLQWMGLAKPSRIVANESTRVTRLSRKAPQCSNLKRNCSWKNIMTYIRLIIKTEGSGLLSAEFRYIIRGSIFNKDKKFSSHRGSIFYQIRFLLPGVIFVGNSSQDVNGLSSSMERARKRSKLMFWVMT